MPALFNYGYDWCRPWQPATILTQPMTPERDETGGAAGVPPYGTEEQLTITVQSCNDARRRAGNASRLYGFVRDWDVGGPTPTRSPARNAQARAAS
ncbi:MAG: hypothetical protein R2873_26020 [Caldilineaceae bacterium]